MMRSSVPIASAIFPADENDAIPSPRHVEYASIEWLTWGLHAARSESATAPESETGRLGFVGAVVSVSALGMSRIAAWPSCWALARDARARSATTARVEVCRRNIGDSITTGVLPTATRDSTC
jgi:hypothetical protein